LPQLSLWHIEEIAPELPVFADTFVRELPQHFLGTEFWQTVENGARLATVETKQFLRWCIAEFYV
jgi:hypothetical protein